MPNIKSAKKKMKQDITREARNKNYKSAIDDIMKKAKTAKPGIKKTKELVSKAYSVIDKAAKKNVIHDKKADRLKRGVSKLVAVKK